METELAVFKGAAPVLTPAQPAAAAFALEPSNAYDDLKLILGIGPALERTLNEIGIRHYRQIARWSEDDIDSYAARLGSFGNRVRRDNWIEGAREQHFLKYGDRI